MHEDESAGTAPRGWSFRARALAVALELLGGGVYPLEMAVHDAAGRYARLVWVGSEAEAEEGEEECPPDARRAVPPPAGPPGLSPLAWAILAQATPVPQTAKRLCALASRPYNAHTRAAVAELTRGGHLVRTPDGLSLPAR
jgi:hypothetical protein